MKRTVLTLLFFSLWLFHGSFAVAQVSVDTDGDGISDDDEQYLYHTDPAKADTDDDGHDDGEEIRNGYSPLQAKRVKLTAADTDKDGLNDALEIALHTDLTNSDSDNDGYKDGVEVYAGFNPLQGNNDRSLSRRVEVDLSKQRLKYFLNDVEIGTIPVSTGLPRTPTPTGEFAIFAKKPVVHYVGPGYDLPNTKWNLEFKPSYYLHGAYWHNQFGIRPMSHGCVNIAYKNAEKLYKFLDVGDMVKIVGATPRTGARLVATKT